MNDWLDPKLAERVWNHFHFSMQLMNSPMFESHLQSRGICAFLNEHFSQTSAELDEDRETLMIIFHMWPDFSGNERYPVPGFDKGEVGAYNSSPHKWEGDYGYLRCQLYIFILRVLVVYMGRAHHFGLERRPGK